MFGGIRLRNACLVPTINPNSKLNQFISVLIDSTPKHQFLTRPSCVIVCLLSRAQMCAVFWSTDFGRCPPESTCLRVAVVCGSTEIKMTRSKTFSEILTLVRNCAFCVEFKSEFDIQKSLSFREEMFSLS